MQRKVLKFRNIWNFKKLSVIEDLARQIEKMGVRVPVNMVIVMYFNLFLCCWMCTLTMCPGHTQKLSSDLILEGSKNWSWAEKKCDTFQ